MTLERKRFVKREAVNGPVESSEAKRCKCARCDLERMRVELKTLVNYRPTDVLERNLESDGGTFLVILKFHEHRRAQAVDAMWHHLTTKDPFPDHWYPGINNFGTKCLHSGETLGRPAYDMITRIYIELFERCIVQYDRILGETWSEYYRVVGLIPSPWREIVTQKFVELVENWKVDPQKDLIIG